ncbi:MAG: EF-hand domain-containing protein, partial [Chthoniobacteraceae bacterium]
MKHLITTLGALAFAGSLAFAEDKPPGPPPGGPGGPGGRERPNPEEAFKKLDANSDNSLSLEEFKANPRFQKEPARADEAFKKMDKDSDGKVSLEEFKTGRPQRGPGGPGGGGGDGPQMV